MGFGSDFGLDTLFDVGAVAAAPFTGGASLAASPTLSGFASDAMLGALGDLGSAAIGGGLSFLGQSSANQYNAQAARDQMAFQERMRDTQYQSAVKDLRAAGLNPMMAYGNIHTASPSGALGVGAQNTLAGVGQAISNVKPSETMKRGEETANLRSQNAQIAESIKLIEQQRATSAAQEADALASVPLKTSQIGLNSASGANQRAQALKTMEEAKYVAAQRAEVEAKKPLWNLFGNQAQTVKEISESSTAENVRRAANNARAIRFQGKRDVPRNITIYGDAK